MKRIIALIGMAMLILFIVGCENGGTTPTTTQAPSGNAAVDSVGTDINNIDVLNNELNTDDMSNISNDLDQVNW